MIKDAIYSGEKEVRTFTILNRGVESLIKKTEQEKEGSFYTELGAIVLTAFTFEAYLNHLGEFNLKLWKPDKFISVWEKYKILCKELNIHPDLTKRPYITLEDLIDFRNVMAHGRTEDVIVENKEVSSQDNPHDHAPNAWWEDFCTLENAKLVKNDISEIITELNKAADLGDYPFRHGIALGSIHLKP
jgi:hypothetical protein